MALKETFVAYDQDQNEYHVNVNCVGHRPVAGEVRQVCDYSLAATGEIIQPQKDNPRLFLIRSTNTLIADIRDPD